MEGDSAAGGGGILPDSFTKILIHSDTDDGSTTFTDSSPSEHTITPTGNVHHETDKKRFGKTSIYFDGSGDFLTIPDSAEHNFTNSDNFTVDFWIYPTASSGNPTIFSSWGTGDNSANAGDHYLYYQQSTGNLFWGGGNVASAGSEWETGVSLSDNVWQHIALVFDADNDKAYAFKNGVRINSGAAVCAITATANDLKIGDDNNINYLKGYLDEFRISKGIARWTSDFLPQSTTNHEGSVSGISRLNIGASSTQSAQYELNVDGDVFASNIETDGDLEVTGVATIQEINGQIAAFTGNITQSAGNHSFTKSGNQYILKSTGGSLRLKHEGSSAGDDIIFELSDGGKQHIFDHDGSITFAGDILIDKPSGGNITIDSGGGDGYLQFKNASSVRWSIGRDNTDNALVFNYGDGLGSSGGQLKLAPTSGNATFAGNVTLDTANGTVKSTGNLYLGTDGDDDAIVIADGGTTYNQEATFNKNATVKFTRSATLGTSNDVSNLNSYAPYTDGELVIHNSANNEVGSFASLFFYAGQQASTTTNAGVGRITVRKSTNANYVSEMGFWTRASDGDLNQNMVIDQSGNVGIGTSSPAELLHVKKSSGEAKISVDGTTYSTMLFKEGGSDQWAMGYDASNNRFFINEEGVASQLVIADGGNATFAGDVGIEGDATLYSALQVNGNTTLGNASSDVLTVNGDIRFGTNTKFNIGTRSSGASAWLGFGQNMNNLKIGDSDFATAIAEFNMSANTTALQVIKDSGAFTGYFYNDNGTAQGLHIKCKSNDAGQTGRYLIKAEGYGSSGGFTDNFLVDIDGNATFAGKVVLPSSGNVLDTGAQRLIYRDGTALYIGEIDNAATAGIAVEPLQFRAGGVDVLHLAIDKTATFAGNVAVGGTHTPSQPLHVRSANHSPRVSIDRTSTSGTADVSFRTNDAEDDGCWTFRMNPDGATTTTPSIALERWTSTDARVVEFNNDLSTAFFGDVNISATEGTLKIANTNGTVTTWRMTAWDAGKFYISDDNGSTKLFTLTASDNSAAFTGDVYSSTGFRTAGYIKMNNAQALQAEDSGGTQRELLKLSSGNVLQIAPANHAVTFGTGTATFAGDISVSGGNVDINSSALNAVGDLGDADDYAIVIRQPYTTGQGTGIAFANDGADHIGGAIVHIDRGSNNLGDLAFYTKSGSTGAPSLALTLDSSQNATFTGRVDIGNHGLSGVTWQAVIKKSSFDESVANSASLNVRSGNAVGGAGAISIGGNDNQGIWSKTVSHDHYLNLTGYSAINFYTDKTNDDKLGTKTLALTLDDSQNATFAGQVRINTASAPQLRVSHTNGTSYMDIHHYYVAVWANNEFIIKTSASGDPDESMRVTPDGKVGIGTTSPQTELTVKTATNRNISFAGGGDIATGVCIMGTNDANSANIPLEFRGSVNCFTTGNVGIGITAPEGLLSFDASDSNTPKIRFQNAAGVTGDAALSTYEDASGTSLLIGSNLITGSGGAIARFNTGEESCGIQFNRTGAIQFMTGGTGATATVTTTFDSAGNANFTGNVDVTGNLSSSDNIWVDQGKSIYYDGGSNTYINSASADHLNFWTGGNNVFTLGDNATFTGNVAVNGSTLAEPLCVVGTFRQQKNAGDSLQSLAIWHQGGDTGRSDFFSYGVDSSTKGAFAFYGTSGTGTGDTKYLELDTSGNATFGGKIALGGGSPSLTNQLMHIKGASGTDKYAAMIENTSSDGFGVYIHAASGTRSALHIRDYSVGTDLFSVKGNGDTTIAGDIVTQGDMVHLGSTDADFRIVFSSKGGVYGGGSASSNAFHNIRGTGSNIIFNTGGASDTFIYEYNGNGAKQTFNSDGSATFAGDVTAYSDIRLKENINTIDSALDKVVKMRGVTFDRIKDGKSGAGVLADELESIAPELVHDGEYKSVSYGNLTSYLIEAIKELKQEVEVLRGAAS